MSEDINNIARNQALSIGGTAMHKFPVGTHVFHKTGVQPGKGLFRITRLLPDGGAGLQYRIKGETEGFERVVTESSLEEIS
ncbi:MAG: hypothetical protein L0Y57_06180 [Beijerinckiaceae bacterium]|nr:hypothetical protein [Beijerinckiaceae bacterium]